MKHSNSLIFACLFFFISNKLISLQDLNKNYYKGSLLIFVEALEYFVDSTEYALEKIAKPVRDYIKKNQDIIINNPYKNKVAHVRHGYNLSDKEVQFRKNRFEYTKYAQEKFLKMNLDEDEVLEIVCSCSGGGWRSMICSMGFCLAAKEIGVLDTAMYVASLSGSTWFLGPWISSGLDIFSYKKSVNKKITNGLTIPTFDNLSSYFSSIWTKFAFNQHINVIDIYSALLSNSLFSDMKELPHKIFLSGQQKNIMSGQFPMPIYSAIYGGSGHDSYWFHFTPFEGGSSELGYYIPSWSLGREFEKGISKRFEPEENLGFLLATSGSAFAAKFNKIYDKTIDKLVLPTYLEDFPFSAIFFNAAKNCLKSLIKTDLGDLRITTAKIYNYMYKMDGAVLKNKTYLKLVDAGLDFNNPIFTTYRNNKMQKAPDVIFIFDSSKTVGKKQLKKLEKYAKKHNLKLPKINYKDVDKKIISVFQDDDLSVPIIFYMPRIVDHKFITLSQEQGLYNDDIHLLKDFDYEKAVHSGFAGTFNFNYTQNQVDKLFAMTHFNMMLSKNIIKKVLKKRIKKKRELKDKKVM